MENKLYKNLLNNINNGIECVTLTYLNPTSDTAGSIDNKVLLTKYDIDNKTFTLDDKVYSSINTSISTGKIEQINTNDNKLIIVEPFFPKPRLIVFGGGHIAKPLVEFASKVGFCVSVVDDRPYFANTTRFPDAKKVICEDFSKSFNIINFRESDFIVIVTRGHRHDGLVLRNILKHKVRYIGMIGSKRRVKGMMEELLSEGFDKESLSNINSPIGLDIDAITPDEIAISIVAQLISFKNKCIINNTSKKHSYPDFDDDVISKISVEDDMPKAILTILSSKGSVPRKSGAKMISYIDGRTLGSIGGGCSEAQVLTKSRELMINKGYTIENVDMTGDVAESIGMVCGGTMDVLVEVL